MSTRSQAAGETMSGLDPDSWPLERKVALVLEGLRGYQPVTVLCREAGVSPSRFYQWRERFIRAGRNGIAQSENERHELEERIRELEAENATLRTEKEIFKSVAIED